MDRVLETSLKNTAVLKARDLIERKVMIQSRFGKEHLVEVEALGTLRFRTPTYFDIEDARVYDNGKSEDEMLIFGTLLEPNLKDVELQQEFGATRPEEIVRALFLPGEIAQIAHKLVGFAGYDQTKVRVVEELKNE